jgi:hypothetical protein
VVSNANGQVIAVCTQKMSSTEVNTGEAKAALLAANVALSFAPNHLIM